MSMDVGWTKRREGGLDCNSSNYCTTDTCALPLDYLSVVGWKVNFYVKCLLYLEEGTAALFCVKKFFKKQ